ncbi:UNVERIFIED_CONTAM: hypothetical protein IGO34_30330, partial [Salmonella enterica subsp. enterica serovar Weltevreden]
IFHIGQRHRLAWAYLASMPEALADPQNIARGFFVEKPRADGAMATMPGAPFRAQQSPWREAPQREPAANDAAAPAQATAPASAAPFAGL